jgi:hypothetical protein
MPCGECGGTGEDHNHILAAAFEACRETSPAGVLLTSKYRDLHALLHEPAYLRKRRDPTFRESSELMQECRDLEDAADRHAELHTFNTGAQA